MYRVKVKRNIGIQAGPATMGRQNMATQCELLQNSNEKGSYQREVSTSGKHLTYDELVQNFLQSNTATIDWLKHIGLLASETLCPTCFTPMRWTTCMDRSDGFKYECRGGQAVKRHRVEQSIRHGSWFEKSNLTLQEVMKITYWWCADFCESQVKTQLRINSNTIVDWSMFCREICELSIVRRTEPLGGKGIYECKLMKARWANVNITVGILLRGNGSSGPLKRIPANVLSRPLRTELKRHWFL